MNHLRELYQEIILDHHHQPRNFGVLQDANRQAEGFNPLCGDKITIYLKIDGDKIEDVKFKGCGCAISTASASLMTEDIKGKSLAEAQQLFQHFHHMLTQDDMESDKALGKLQVMVGVRAFPARVKCATLAWHTLKAALEDMHEPVSTE